MHARSAPLVAVPDVVGMPFHVGRDVASAARVSLASDDPDGPPIGSIAWPGLWWILSQDPQPGTRVHEWESVAIEVARDGATGDGAAEIPPPLDGPPIARGAARDAAPPGPDVRSTRRR